MSSPITFVGSIIENIKSPTIEESVSPYFEIDQIVAFRQIFGFLNDKDRDILYLIFVSRKKQLEVKRILKRSQPSLCYDIKKIRGRLKYIFYIFSNFDIFIDFIEHRAFSILTPVEIAVLTGVFYTSSFTLAARITHYSQVKIRYTFKQSLDKLKAAKVWDMYEIFTTICENQNSLKRVHKFDKNRFDVLSITIGKQKQKRHVARYRKLKNK